MELEGDCIVVKTIANCFSLKVDMIDLDVIQHHLDKNKVMRRAVCGGLNLKHLIIITRVNINNGSFVGCLQTY